MQWWWRWSGQKVCVMVLMILKVVVWASLLDVGLVDGREGDGKGRRKCLVWMTYMMDDGITRIGPLNRIFPPLCGRYSSEKLNPNSSINHGDGTRKQSCFLPLDFFSSSTMTKSENIFRNTWKNMKHRWFSWNHDCSKQNTSPAPVVKIQRSLVSFFILLSAIFKFLMGQHVLFLSALSISFNIFKIFIGSSSTPFPRFLSCNSPCFHVFAPPRHIGRTARETVTSRKDRCARPRCDACRGPPSAGDDGWGKRGSWVDIPHMDLDIHGAYGIE